MKSKSQQGNIHVTKDNPLATKIRGQATTLASAPAERQDLSELAVDGVGGEETGLVHVTGDTDLGVDVKHTINTAWGPDVGGLVDVVSQAVVRVEWADEWGLGAGLAAVTGEVVGGLLETLLVPLEAGVSAVGGGEDAVLPSGWVAEVDVQLAVLAALGGWDTRADGSNILIEDQSEGGSVRGNLLSDTASGAAYDILISILKKYFELHYMRAYQFHQ